MRPAPPGGPRRRDTSDLGVRHRSRAERERPHLEPVCHRRVRRGPRRVLERRCAGAVTGGRCFPACRSAQAPRALYCRGPGRGGRAIGRAGAEHRRLFVQAGVGRRRIRRRRGSASAPARRTAPGGPHLDRLRESAAHLRLFGFRVRGGALPHDPMARRAGPPDWPSFDRAGSPGDGVGGRVSLAPAAVLPRAFGAALRDGRPAADAAPGAAAPGVGGNRSRHAAFPRAPHGAGPGSVERRHGTLRGEALLGRGRRRGEGPAGALDLLANAYVRVRPAREFLDVKSGSEAGLRGALGYAIAPSRAWVPRRLYLELEGRSFLRAGFAAGTAPAEWRLGGTVCPVGSFAVDLAGGSALSDGVGAPRSRFLLGFAWSPPASA